MRINKKIKNQLPSKFIFCFFNFDTLAAIRKQYDDDKGEGGRFFFS